MRTHKYGPQYAPQQVEQQRHGHVLLRGRTYRPTVPPCVRWYGAAVLSGPLSGASASCARQNRIPPHRIPPHRIPPNRIPPHRIPPNRIPPHRIPPNRIPPHRIPTNRIPPHRIPPQDGACRYAHTCMRQVREYPKLKWPCGGCRRSRVALCSERARRGAPLCNAKFERCMLRLAA